jgi:hypothetical protein
VIEFDTTTPRMVAEHARGDGYRAIGRRHGMSHERARQIVMCEGTRFVDSIEMDLYVAAKLEKMGREAAWPTMLIPFQDQAEWQTALALVQWVTDRLRARDVPVHVRNRTTPVGHALQLTLGTPGAAP